MSMLTYNYHSFTVTLYSHFHDSILAGIFAILDWRGLEGASWTRLVEIYRLVRVFTLKSASGRILLGFTKVLLIFDSVLGGFKEIQ